MRALAAALLASAWLGATVFFTVGVAPGVFAALASPPLAGRVIGRVLPPLFYAGLAIGLVMGILDTSWKRWAGLAMAISCAIAQFVIAPRIDPGQSTFALFHGLSVAFFSVAMIAALVFVIAAWRSNGQHSR